MKKSSWFPTAALLGTYITLAIVTHILTLAMSALPVQAAQPAPPEVKECQEINTAAVGTDMVIKVFRCEPENGTPFKINSLGFMLDEEY